MTLPAMWPSNAARQTLLTAETLSSLFFWCLTSSKLHAFDRLVIPYNKKKKVKKEIQAFFLLSFQFISALRTLFPDHEPHIVLANIW